MAPLDPRGEAQRDVVDRWDWALPRIISVLGHVLSVLWWDFLREVMIAIAWMWIIPISQIDDEP